MTKRLGLDTAGENFNTFGELLKYLRQRARLTQQALGTAVGYSYAQIARLESGSRLPDPAAVRARFIEALDLAHAPDLAQSLLDLAERAHQASEVPQTSPAKATSHRPPTNLFARLTRFVGRERDLAEVQRLIAANRLVTLTGAGGVGKTRLALETAERALDDYPDGVWLVELAPLTDETLVARAIATTFRLLDDLGRPKLQLLTEHIGSKHMLMVLDNCEHVIAASADAAETLLRACPNLSILATSRETLQVFGEAAWRVPSMTLAEAIELFKQRALEAMPETALTDDAAATMQKICQRLDGIPLALELAAARLGVYSLNMIAERLDDRFRLLTSGSRTALPRHRTLRALIDWSYNLLSLDEQCLLRWLSVFIGSWTLEGAEAIGRDLDVVNLLPQLINKSLVTVIDRANERRFSMLETIRQYAAERLNEAGESRTAYEQAANHLEQRANQLGVDDYGVNAIQLNQLESELDNVRGLIAWARGQADISILFRFAVKLGEQFTWGYLAESLAWVEEAIRRGEEAAVDLRAAALRLYVRQCFFGGYNLASRNVTAEQLVTISEQLDSKIEKAIGMVWAGAIAWHCQNHSQALILYDHGLSLSLTLPLEHRQVLTNAYWGMGLVHTSTNDVNSAIDCFEKCLHAGLEANISRAICAGLSGLTWIDVRLAIVQGEKVLVGWQAQTHDDLRVRVMQTFSQALIVDQRYDQASEVLKACLEMMRRHGMRWDVGMGSAQALLDLGQLAWLQGDSATAQFWYEQSLEEYNQVGDQERIARLHTFIGYTQLTKGDLQSARSHFRHGLDIYHKLQQPAGIAMSLAAYAALAEAQGNQQRAVKLYGAASIPPDFMVLSPLWPANPVLFQHEMAKARMRFAEPKWSLCWIEGERMSQAQATTLVLEN